MAIIHLIWDLADDPDGNVQHVAEHDATMREVEEVLLNPNNIMTRSRSTGHPMTFGWTSTGKHLAVVWQHVQDDPLTIYPLTAYPTPPPRRKRR